MQLQQPITDETEEIQGGLRYNTPTTPGIAPIVTENALALPNQLNTEGAILLINQQRMVAENGQTLAHE